MSGLALAKAFPEVSEQFPDSSVLMPYELRTEVFWPICSRLLQGVVDVNEIGETPPEGWRSLKISQTALLHQVALLHPEQRIAIGTTVSESSSRLQEKVVHGNIRIFRGKSALEVNEYFGSECVEHKGLSKSGLTFRGVIGERGNPYFSRPGLDCDPEIQDLTLWVKNQEDEDVDEQYGEDTHSEFTISNIAHYAFFDKPPRGDDSLIALVEYVADLLENVAYQTV